MVDTFFKLFELLTPKQRREFYLLQVIMLMASLVELVGTASIMPFIALAADPAIVETNHYLSLSSDFLGNPSEDRFLLIVGACFISFVLLSNALLFFSQFLMSRYSFRLGGEISSRLYGYYLERDILFHGRTNSATLTQRVLRDAFTLSTNLIAPALRMNARFFSIILLSGLIIFVNPVIAFTTLFVLGLVYWFIFRVIRQKIYDNGNKVITLGRTRNKLLNESFGGIKDLKLYALERRYLDHYANDTKVSNRASADNEVLGDFPYYLVEAVLLTGMVIMILYLYSSQLGLGPVLPVLTLYAMAGMKIVPKVQQSYLAITKIRSAQPAFRVVYADLRHSSRRATLIDSENGRIRPRASFGLSNIYFSYDESLPPVFSDYSINFTVGEITAIVGGSGAGKSTLLDILMGLIDQDSGVVLIDGEVIPADQFPNWRASVGYVPQEVYLTDATAAENIAFGMPVSDIDMDRVRRAARMAKIDDFINTLPEAYQTNIGERGSQFSGGQKQRLGLARAFYREVDVLLLDEATSALDAETQGSILRGVKALTPKLTVIMVTHRAETIAIADRIIELEPERQQAPCEVGSEN